jgi:Pretoxin HINT domain
MSEATTMMLGWICAALIAGTPTSDPTSPPDQSATYQEVRAKAGRSSEEQVKVALWCEAHGLTAERLHHLTLAILADPTNTTARGLMGLVSHEGRWRHPEAVADALRTDPDRAATLADYELKRQKAAYTADAQWALGLWAGEHGLPEQAKAHLTAVIRLDPSREAAWKKLGYKKHDGRWVTDAQLALEKADTEVQKAADRKWKPLLEKYKTMLGQPSKREEAEAALANVTDPRAVPTIGRLFASTEATQALAARLLGQIDSPASSRALAFLSVFADSADARRISSETLRNRDPREFAHLLIALLRAPIRYEVRPVGGPGTPGVLFVEGKDANVQRRYSPPSVASMLPGGRPIAYDEFGMPIYYTSLGQISNSTARIPANQLLQMIEQTNQSHVVNPQLPAYMNNNPEMHAIATVMANNALESQKRFNVGLANEIARVGKAEHKNPSQFGFGITHTETFSEMTWTTSILLEAQKSAFAAQQQLASDVAALDAYNRDIVPLNDRVQGILAAVAGKDLGKDAKAWKNWWVDQLGYRSNMTAQAPPKPTIVQDVPLAYQPQPVPVREFAVAASEGFQRMSCFGAGTPVQTVEGLRPIESLRVGDLVLTQSTDGGALGYKSILVVHHNPPSATFRVKLGGESIISSHFHRFWIAGRGWVMARDLKVGDPVRTLGGVSPVEAIAADKVQLVYNLDVADDADFFAGNLGALVHDNTLPDPRLVPFDTATKAAK